MSSSTSTTASPLGLTVTEGPDQLQHHLQPRLRRVNAELLQRLASTLASELRVVEQAVDVPPPWRTCWSTPQRACLSLGG